MSLYCVVLYYSCCFLLVQCTHVQLIHCSLTCTIKPVFKIHTIAPNTCTLYLYVYTLCKVHNYEHYNSVYVHIDTLFDSLHTSVCVPDTLHLTWGGYGCILVALFTLYGFSLYLSFLISA